MQPGDTRWFIAAKVYGDSSQWKVVFEANRDVLSDPSRLQPDQVLKIPPKP